MRGKKYSMACAVSLLSLAFLAGGSVRAEQVTANWNGGTGDWTNPAKWSTGVIPLNGTNTYVVNIDNGAPAASSVIWSGSPSVCAIDALHIDAGDSLSLGFRTLTLGALTVDGSLKIGSSAAVYTSTLLDGNGVIQFDDRSLVNLCNPTGALTIGAGLTVSQPGPYFTGYASLIWASIGNASYPLINKGHVVVEQSAFAVVGSTIDNQGILEVKNGGVLQIQSNFSLASIGTLINNGGTIVVMGTLDNTGQTLNLSRAKEWYVGGIIRGGTIQSTGPGSLGVDYMGDATLDGVELNTTVYVDGGLTVINGISGHGTIAIGNPEAIEGSGNINIPTIPSGITVRGGIDASFDSSPGQKARICVTTNQGLIRAQKSDFNSSANLYITASTVYPKPTGLSIENDGELQVSDGGYLKSLDSLIFSKDAIFTVDGGGALAVAGSLTLGVAGDRPSLQVSPKADGTAYNNYPILTYTGMRVGIFDLVTPGITVTYSGKTVYISGTPVPEPSSAVLLASAGVLVMWPRRLRGGLRRRG